MAVLYVLGEGDTLNILAGFVCKIAWSCYMCFLLLTQWHTVITDLCCISSAGEC